MSGFDYVVGESFKKSEESVTNNNFALRSILCLALSSDHDSFALTGALQAISQGNNEIFILFYFS